MVPKTLPTDTPVAERFWSRVDKTETCWNWVGGRKRTGYGVIKVGGRNARAHVVSFKIENGDIPDGMIVDHICHNRACVRPDHLRLATTKQNAEHRTGAQSNSKSGIRGVTWDKDKRRWKAAVRHHGRTIFCGYHREIQSAEAAAVAKRLELFTHNDVDRIAS